MKEIKFYDIETFKKARKLTDRKEIASAFNLEGRKALKLTIDADEYGEAGTKVKIAYSLDGMKVYEVLTLRRYSDSEEITLEDKGYTGIYKNFGFGDVLKMYEENNLVEVEDGDKVVLLVENTKYHCGSVLTGTLRLPKYRVGYSYKGLVELD